MPGINIPGVSNKYNTTETVEKLMQIERVPLTREQKTLDTYKSQQDAWRDINRKMTSLRDSAKSLYSFENPFNNKLTTSSDEFAITASASRNASYDTFKVDVIQTASTDRFLTSELDKDTKVPAGTYTYRVNDKTVSLRWKGGSLTDFSEALNRRGNDLIKSRVIGASKGKKTLSIESLKTGEENRLSFEDDAKTFAETSGMIIKVKPKTTEFATSKKELQVPAKSLENITEQKGLPSVSNREISISNEKINVPPRSGFSVKIPEDALKNKENHIQFTITRKQVEDITEELNKIPEKPELPDAGNASFKDITIYNSPFSLNIQDEQLVPKEKIDSVQTNDILYIIMKDGSEKLIETPDILTKENTTIDLKLQDFSSISAITIQNRNTGYHFEISKMKSFNPKENLGFTPQHPISTAQDAIIKYEGITIKRPSNEIDDVIPEVTLNIHEKTEKTATLSVKPDVESAKDALITFVGNYNQAVTQINILSQTKPEIVEEITYLSEEEKESEMKKLGMFTSDSSLTSLKSSLQNTVLSKYNFSDSAQITMLSQIGIATNASNYSGYTPGKLRGYLEIDEKKLDETLEKHLDDIKNLFGYDSDGDLIIDSGIASKLDKQLTAYVQSGGIFSMKISSLDSKIKSSEQKISRLEIQLSEKEQDLKSKYGQMEGALNSLENQQNTINNFTNQQNKR